MKLKTKFFIAVPTLLVLGLAFVTWCLFQRVDPNQLKAPTDQELIATFHNHRTSFERLRQMVTEDMPARSYFSEAEFAKEPRTPRTREYSARLNEIQPGLEVGASDKSIRFIFATNGLLAIGPGAFKGIEYLPGSIDTEGVLMKNLDHHSSLPIGEVYLREIEPNWFVIVQKLD